MTDKLSDLHFDQQNPRKHDERNLKVIGESLKATGPARSIVIDEDDNILAGNGVTEAARAAGIEKVVVIEAEEDALIAVRKRGLTPEQKIALKYYDNRAGELAAWEPEQILADLNAGIDLGQFWGGGELNAILADLNTETKADPGPQVDKAAELAAKWGTQTGQVWTLGEHRLAVGDCTDKAVVESVMRGERADIEIHDPPYGISLDTDWSAAKSRLDFAAEKRIFGGKKHKPIEGDFVDYDPLFLFERDSIPKEMFLWGADYYIEKIPNRNNGSWLIWDKRLDEAGDRMYGSAFEMCWSLSRHKRDFIRVKWAGIFGTEQEPDHKRLHPTQKPVLLYEWILSRYSKEGDISSDFYLGAGSHLIACEQLRRKCRAIEIDPGYCAVTLQRWADLTGQEPELLG